MTILGVNLFIYMTWENKISFYREKKPIAIIITRRYKFSLLKIFENFHENFVIF